MMLNTKECLERYGSYHAFDSAIRSGTLIKLERGIYSDTKEYVPSEDTVQKMYPSAVFTMESAFLYHKLTDMVPDTYSMATSARTAV